MNVFEIPPVTDTHRGSAGWFVAEGRVHLICEKCGRHTGCLDNHTIEADGTVYASILCASTVFGIPCGWHVMGRLAGWKHGHKSPAQLVSLT